MKPPIENRTMRVAIDFDGTIADTNQVKADWILRELGTAVEPWRCDRTNCVPIIGFDAYKKMADFVYERDSTLRTPEVSGAADALRRLSTTAELHVVTARASRRLEFAREWCAQNRVLDRIEAFHSAKDVSKEEVCRALGATVLIDDDIRHLEAVRLAGLRRIHFQNGCPDATEPTSGIVVCRSWPEVVEALEAG